MLEKSAISSHEDTSIESDLGKSLARRLNASRNPGFGEFWPDRARYLGTAELGSDAVPHLHFPGLDPASVDWLVTQRKIRAIGLDTASIDHGQSTDFAAHVALFEHNVPAFENVARVEQLPPRDFTVIALPAKIGGGSGGPLRIVALIDP